MATLLPSRGPYITPAARAAASSAGFILVRIPRGEQAGAALSSTVGEFFGSSGRRIRDVVWGDVPIDRAVRTLLESRALERLKGMSQLGFTFAAFPRARHTRLDHAIGVYHLTRLTLKKIMDSGAYLESRDVQAAQDRKSVV